MGTDCSCRVLFFEQGRFNLNGNFVEYLQNIYLQMFNHYTDFTFQSFCKHIC